MRHPFFGALPQSFVVNAQPVTAFEYASVDAAAADAARISPDGQPRPLQTGDPPLVCPKARSIRGDSTRRDRRLPVAFSSSRCLLKPFLGSIHLLRLVLTVAGGRLNLIHFSEYGQTVVAGVSGASRGRRAMVVERRARRARLALTGRSLPLGRVRVESARLL